MKMDEMKEETEAGGEGCNHVDTSEMVTTGAQQLTSNHLSSLKFNVSSV